MIGRWAHAVALVVLLANGIAGVTGCGQRPGHEAVCGDGVVEPPETCDGDCPDDCDDSAVCTADVLSGNPDTCDVQCANDPIVTCVSGDGCCPGGCNALNDTDCILVCGNGVVEPPETCDGNCPTNCDDENACTVDERLGSAETCNVDCTHEPIVTCTGGDGCCPGNGWGTCSALNDDDCAPLCGNGVIEPPEECDDGSTIGGDGCSAGCTIEVCGNGIQDVGEACDDGNSTDGDGCSADCLSDETCGNGVLDAVTGEECDDGNGVDWDGCTGCAITEFQVNTYTAGAQSAPAVATTPDGRFVVVWESWGGQDGHWVGVFGQLYNNSGNLVGGEFQVNTYSQNDQHEPKVVMAPDGRFVVVWTSTLQDGSGTGVYGQRYDSGGSPAGSEFPVNSYIPDYQLSPSVSITADGNFVVTWGSYSSNPANGQDGSAAGVFGQRFDSNGVPLGGEFQVNTHTDGSQAGPRVMTTADGTALVVWNSSDTDVSRTGSFGQRYDSNGSPFGGEFQVVFDQFPELPLYMTTAMDAVGNFVMIRDGAELMGQLFSSSAAPASSFFQVNTYSLIGVLMWPDVAMAGDGRFVVVWNSNGQDGDYFGVFGQRFDSSGVPTGGEFQVNTYWQGYQGSPAVATAGDGSFVVAWSSDGQDGDAAGIFAKRYDAQGNPLGRGP